MLLCIYFHWDIWNNRLYGIFIIILYLIYIFLLYLMKLYIFTLSSPTYLCPNFFKNIVFHTVLVSYRILMPVSMYHSYGVYFLLFHIALDRESRSYIWCDWWFYQLASFCGSLVVQSFYAASISSFVNRWNSAGIVFWCIFCSLQGAMLLVG